MGVAGALGNLAATSLSVTSQRRDDWQHLRFSCPDWPGWVASIASLMLRLQLFVGLPSEYQSLSPGRQRECRYR